MSLSRRVGSLARRGAVLALCVAGVLAGAWLGGCSQRGSRAQRAVEATSSRVDVFLRCVDPSARPLGFELESAELRGIDGALHVLAVERASVTAAELARRVRLAGSIVPPGEYNALILRVRSAWLESPEGRATLEVGTGSTGGNAFEVPVSVELRQRDAASLFLEWRAAESLTGGAGFTPALGLSTEAPQTALGLLYVSDAGTSSVLAIDRASGQVVGTYKTGASPEALVLTRDRRRLWVANAGDGSLSEIDVRQGSAQGSVPISFSAGTCDITLGDRDRWLVAVNRELDSISLLTSAGAGLTQVQVGRRPVRAAASPELQRVYVANQGDDTVSVIDLSSRTVVASVAVESRPSDVEVGSDGELALVAHVASPNLLVIGAESLARRSTIFVGNNATDVLADRSVPRAYVARSRPPELVVVDLRMAAVVRRIPLSGPVAQMSQSRTGSRVYAASPELGAVLVIDVVVGKEEALIRCGSRPTDVVIAD